jgi:hypothetical protein
MQNKGAWSWSKLPRLAGHYYRNKGWIRITHHPQWKVLKNLGQDWSVTCSRKTRFWTAITGTAKHARLRWNLSPHSLLLHCHVEFDALCVLTCLVLFLQPIYINFWQLFLCFKNIFLKINFLFYINIFWFFYHFNILISKIFFKK